MRLLILVFIALAIMGCKFKGKSLIISDACQTSYELFYKSNDGSCGRFTLTENEVDHMRPINQTKISNFKAWFQQQCPKEYAMTCGGAKKK